MIADPSIKIENVNSFKPPNSTPIDTELFRTIARVSKLHHPRSVGDRKKYDGYTESQLYRQLGITCYGWAPAYTTVDENEEYTATTSASR